MELSQEVIDKLLPYQIAHTQRCIDIFNEYGRLLDSSDTGTGKSYALVALLYELKLRALVLTPKAVITGIQKAFEHFGVVPLGISNYESIQNCKYYPKLTNTRKVCPYITKELVDVKKKKVESDDDDDVIIRRKDSDEDTDEEQNDEEKKIVHKGKKKYKYTWNLPKRSVVIFDEAHRCKNANTNTSKLLYDLANTEDAKIILLSATICDKEKTFALCGFVLRLYPALRDMRKWMRHINKEYGNDDTMVNVHKKIEPYTSRMRIKDIGDAFSENTIFFEAFDTKDEKKTKEINDMYNEIKEAQDELKKKQDSGNAFSKLMYARMRIEQLKTGIFISETKKHIEEGKSVAIFVNFTETLNILFKKLGGESKCCFINGTQKKKEDRDKQIALFQKNKRRIIVCNIQSGDVGISLHDLSPDGSFPRVSLISPCDSACRMVQIFGRIHRAKAVSPVRQYIICCKGTLEEAVTVEDQVSMNVKDKIMSISNLNDGKCNSYEIKNLIDDDETGSTKPIKKVKDADVKVIPKKQDTSPEIEDIMKSVRELTTQKHNINDELRAVNEEYKKYEAQFNSLLQVEKVSTSFQPLMKKLTELNDHKKLLESVYDSLSTEITIKNQEIQFLQLRL